MLQVKFSVCSNCNSKRFVFMQLALGFLFLGVCLLSSHCVICNKARVN